MRNYLTLRKLIGCLGMALPWIMWLGEPLLCHDAGHQPTISHYYYTAMRDTFVGILWALGVFLICYRGTRHWDDLISSVAGFCAITVSLFPTAPRPDIPLDHCKLPPCVIRSVMSPAWQTIDNKIHYRFASAFFIAITCIVFCLFTNRGKHKWTNAVYKICGVTMIGCLLWMRLGGVSFLKETIAVEAFGAAWLVNGIGLFKDPQDRPDAHGHAPASEFA